MRRYESVALVASLLIWGAVACSLTGSQGDVFTTGREGEFNTIALSPDGKTSPQAAFIRSFNCGI